MNQPQLFSAQTPEKLSDNSRTAPEEEKDKEEMVKIPVLGEVNSATGKITFYKNKNV